MEELDELFYRMDDAKLLELLVGRNKKVIAEYIRNQLAEDKISDQISIKEYFGPFTGEQVNKSK